MATLYKADGTSEEVQPANGKNFKLDELYKLVDCQMVEVVRLGGEYKKQILIIDEEGKLGMAPTYLPKPANVPATAVMFSLPRLPGDYIAGNALLCLRTEVK